MAELKKRKVKEEGNNSGLMDSNSAPSSVEDLRSLLDPLAKPLLVELLATLGSQYPFIADEIVSVASADPALRELYVRGLAWNTTTETLYAAFEEHGDIETATVVSDKLTGISRGYGFVTYKDMESAQRALKAPSKMIDGCMACCNLARDGSKSSTLTTDQAHRRLYIAGLSPDTTSEMLLSLFSRHGEIEEGSVAYYKDTNRSRGYGFVTYKTLEGAKRALNDPQKFLGGRILTVKLADNHKIKVTHHKSNITQAQVPATMVPIHLNGYPQAQETRSAPVGYSYPQEMAAYTNSTYSSPPAAAPPYSAQPQHPYPEYPFKKDPRTTMEPNGRGGYPYYMTNH